MKHKTIILAVASVTTFGLVASMSYAGSVGGTGGSTEVTQIMNNGELMNQVTEATYQSQVQMNQLGQLKQMLTSLPTSTLQQMQITPTASNNFQSTTNNVSQAYDKTSSLNSNLRAFSDQITNINRLANLNGVQPSTFVTGEFERFKATGQGIDVERGLERQTVNRIVADNQAANDIMQQVPQTQGMKDTTQLLTSSVARLIGSVNNVGMMAASTQRLQAIKADTDTSQQMAASQNAALRRQQMLQSLPDPSEFKLGK